MYLDPSIRDLCGSDTYKFSVAAINPDNDPDISKVAKAEAFYYSANKNVDMRQWVLQPHVYLILNLTCDINNVATEKLSKSEAKPSCWTTSRERWQPCGNFLNQILLRLQDVNLEPLYRGFNYFFDFFHIGTWARKDGQKKLFSPKAEFRHYFWFSYHSPGVTSKISHRYVMHLLSQRELIDQ